MSSELIFIAMNATTVNNTVFNPSTGGLLMFKNVSQLIDLQIITSVCTNWNMTMIYLTGLLFAGNLTRSLLRRWKKKQALSPIYQQLYEKSDEYAQTWGTMVSGIMLLVLLYHIIW